ncbi:MAG: T9SS type A sorting domain-containing protein [Candidatus Zixiibacteriota bacterium]|nr:MAG: T9SS type A sorting domain-containing protein [candidate division Zixibacteria bacterium]
MLNKILKILVIGGLGLLPASSIGGDVIPTSVWTDFWGSATLYNGDPVPVGSIIDAYDPDGVHCGRDTVTMEGKYGFMPVYGNDSYGDGAEPGETITFYVNSRLAQTLGPDDPIWVGTDIRPEVNLSASGAMSIEAIELPTDKDDIPGATVHYEVTVSNTGDGLDFYTVEATTSHGWIVQTAPGFVYAEPNDTVTLYFDVLIPKAIFYPMDDEVAFRVQSGIEPTLFIDGIVTTHVWIPTDAPDDGDGLLPGGFKLYQNYPNPFNPVTTLAFDLPVKAEVELEVFNMLGSVMTRVSLGTLSSGHHTVEYNGISLASGVYFYRIQAGELSAMKKMVLLK